MYKTKYALVIEKTVVYTIVDENATKLLCIVYDFADSLEK